MSGPRKLGALLSTWNAKGSRHVPIANADESAAALVAAWESAVGQSIARRSRPSQFKAGVLTVLTASSTWSNELSHLAPTIVDALRRTVPEAHLRRLRFMVATGRTRLLLEGERLSLRKLERQTQNVDRSATVSTQQRGGEDVGALVARLACEQKVLNEWRDRSGWGKCTQCGKRFWGAAQGSGTCAPCASGQRRGTEARIELALMQAPWFSVAAVRQMLPRVSEAAYRAARQRLLTRWQSEMLAAERRLRRTALTAADRVTAWSYLMLLAGMPERDIGRAVVSDVLGPLWANALFASAATPREEARASLREKHH